MSKKKWKLWKQYSDNLLNFQVGKCKYNIVRNGDVKHLCDDVCFKRFRSNPTQFLRQSESGTDKNKQADKPKAPIKPVSKEWGTASEKLAAAKASEKAVVSQVGYWILY